MMENSELLPCPFCGDSAQVHGADAPNCFVACNNNCGACGPDATNHDEAIAAWNNRSTETNLTALLDQAEEALEHLLKVRTREGVKPQSRDAAEAKARAALTAIRQGRGK